MHAFCTWFLLLVLILILKVKRTFKSQGYVIGFGGCLVMNTCTLMGEKKRTPLLEHLCVHCAYMGKFLFANLMCMGLCGLVICRATLPMLYAKCSLTPLWNMAKSCCYTCLSTSRECVP